MEHQDTLWVKVYDGEGDGAKLIFEGTAGEWEIFRNTHHWGVPKEIANQSRRMIDNQCRHCATTAEGWFLYNQRLTGFGLEH